MFSQEECLHARAVRMVLMPMEKNFHRSSVSKFLFVLMYSQPLAVSFFLTVLKLSQTNLLNEKQPEFPTRDKMSTYNIHS